MASGIAAGEVVASVLTGGTAVEAPVSVPALVFDFDFDVDSFETAEDDPSSNAERLGWL